MVLIACLYLFDSFFIISLEEAPLIFIKISQKRLSLILSRVIGKFHAA